MIRNEMRRLVEWQDTIADWDEKAIDGFSAGSHLALEVYRVFM